MNVKFFPRDIKFWLLQLSCTTIIALFFASDLSRNDPLFAMHLTGNFVWHLLFILLMLCFRVFFIKFQLYNKSIIKLIVISIFCSAIIGLVLAVLTLAITIPLFWANFYSLDMTRQPYLNVNQYVPYAIKELWKQSQLFTCAWAFVYISVHINRNAKETELFNLRLKNSLKEAQLNSLSNQLNPHFLFNALNNIRFMIHENTMHADNMITSLSDILRYSLESNKQEKVPLSQEVEIINRYISITKAQLENRLHFTLNIEQHLHHYLVPPMALQLLVENAIKHGLDNIKQGGKLTLDAIDKNDQLIFTVANDIPVAASSGKKNTGIGLKNIMQRLHLLYDGKASMNIVKTSTEFIVTMTLPKEIAE